MSRQNTYYNDLKRLIQEEAAPDIFASKLRKYVERGYNPDYANTRDKVWASVPLSVYAATVQSPYGASYIRSLLEAGANSSYKAFVPDNKGGYDGTLLILSIQWANPCAQEANWVNNTARVLLKAGADPNGCDSLNRTALHHAPSPDTVSLLVSYGADIDRCDRFGLTPLYGQILKSVMPAEPETLEALLKAGADPNADGKKGSNPTVEGPPFTRLCKLYGSSQTYGGIAYWTRRKEHLRYAMELLLRYGVNIQEGDPLKYIEDSEEKERLEELYRQCREQEAVVSDWVAAYIR